MTRHQLVMAIIVVLVVVASWDRRSAMAQADTPTPAPMPINSQLTACWEMNEQTGPRIDSSGGANLTDNNTVGSIAGLIGRAASLVAANMEWLSAAHNASLATGSTYTLSIWTAANSAGPLLHKTSDYQLSIQSGQITYGGSTAATASYTLPSGWHHIALVYQSGQMNLYIDGTLRSSLTTSSANSSNDLYIGWDGANEYLTGAIDQTAYWQRALDNQAIAYVYNAGAGVPCAEIRPTPTLSDQRRIDLSSGDWAIIERRISYGEVIVAGLLGLTLVVLIWIQIGLSTDRWLGR